MRDNSCSSGVSTSGWSTFSLEIHPHRANGAHPGREIVAHVRTTLLLSLAPRHSRERNETGLVLPDGSRLSVLFWKELDVDGPDFPLIAAAGDGTVVPLTAGAVTRLKTEAPMQFGEVLVDTDNLAPGFAGAYGLWLKRAGPGWRLVFSHEPDVWGTQYDTAFDAAEIELAYSHDDTSARPFGVSVRPTGADRGRLVLQWGPHEWSADFVTAG